MEKGSLLIVDDEQDILDRLAMILEEHADHIYMANNGIEALKLIKDNNIHCIICDINMPKMNGVELIKQIRSEGNNTPFVFYTAHGNQDLMMEGVKYGAFDFLDKPNLDGLEDVIFRGLKEGFERQKGTSKNTEAFISDYQKLLSQLEVKSDPIDNE